MCCRYASLQNCTSFKLGESHELGREVQVFFSLAEHPYYSSAYRGARLRTPSNACAPSCQNITRLLDNAPKIKTAITETLRMFHLTKAQGFLRGNTKKSYKFNTAICQNLMTISSLVSHQLLHCTQRSELTTPGLECDASGPRHWARVNQTSR